MGKKHIHKYHKVSMNGVKVWACALGNCTHYMPKHMENMVSGKTAICWQCESEFTLDSRNMQEDMPRCYGCNPQFTKLDEFLADLSVSNKEAK